MAMTTRSRTPARRSWRTTTGASRRAARMIAARSVRVMVRGTTSGGGSGGGAMRARWSRARTRRSGSRRGASAGWAPARPAARATDGSRRNEPIRVRAPSARRRPASRWARYRISRARSSASGSPSSSAAMGSSAAGRRGSIARLLMRMSCEATATNALTLPSRSASSVASASRYASARPPSGTVRTSSWRASIRLRSRARGPSKLSMRTVVAVSGRRPSPNRTAAPVAADSTGASGAMTGTPGPPGTGATSDISSPRRR